MIDQRLEHHILHRASPDGFFVRFKGILGVNRSCRLKVLCKIGFANLTGKDLYGSLSFNKVAVCKPATLSKKKTR